MVNLRSFVLYVASALVSLHITVCVASAEDSNEAESGEIRSGSKYALIVGVSEYPSLAKSRQLVGPANDARVLAARLPDFGFQASNIRVLADGVEGAVLPTRAAIIAEFDKLKEQVSRDDYVYLHFSGHGSQQPVPAGEEWHPDAETDGLDEIFLPRDIGRWNGNTGVVANALVDDEVRDFVIALRNRGAFVWVVFDSCHSGDMLRGAPVGEDERDRHISFMELVAPEDRENAVAARDKAAELAVRSRGTPAEQERLAAAGAEELRPDAGGVVAFYAAQTTQTTPEFNQPVGQSPRQAHGLFTFTLLRVLESSPGITYRQAMAQIVRAYEAQNRHHPLPMIEGTAQDALVFGSESGVRVEQYRVSRRGGTLHVEAGTLSEIGPGSILRVVSQPTSGDEDTLGFVEVKSAELVRSTVIPIAYDGREALSPDGVPPSAYARPVERSVSMALRVALPQPPEPTRQRGDSPEAEAWTAAQAALQSLQAQGGDLVDWVSAGMPADVRLTVSEHRLWLMQADGMLCRESDFGSSEACQGDADLTFSIRLARSKVELEKELDDSLRRIAKATNLLRLANLAADPQGGRLELRLEVQRADGTGFEPVTTQGRPKLRDRDRVRLFLDNKGNRQLDVTVLFVDSRWGIVSVYPSSSGQRNRIESGGYDVVEGTIDASATVGVERMVVIAVPVEPGAYTPADFSFLAQPSLPKTRGADSSRLASTVMGRLEQAGFSGGRTRGFAQGTEGAMMSVIAWETRR